MRIGAPAACILTVLISVAAVDGAPLASDVERNARELETRLVAPCCWSQQVSVHQSPAADSIRKDLRARLTRGESRQQILDDYVVQFGERILIEPPARGYKLLLYAFPPIALVLTGAAVAALVRRFTRRRSAGVVDTPTAAGADTYQSRLEDELRDLD